MDEYDLIVSQMNQNTREGVECMSIQPGMSKFSGYDNYDCDYSDASEDDRNQNKKLDQTLQNVSFMLMLQWPLHITPQEINREYERLFNDELNISLDELIQYKRKMRNYWIKYDYQTLTIDPAQYLATSSPTKTKDIIQDKFIKIMNSLHPNGIISNQLSKIFIYFMGIYPTSQQIEYGLDLCDVTLNILKLKSIHQQNINNNTNNNNNNTIKQHVLSYEEMIACALYGFWNNGISILELQRNLQRYFQLDIDFYRPYYKGLLNELVDPIVCKRDNKYLLGWKSRNRLEHLLCWWHEQTIIINHNQHKETSKPRFLCEYDQHKEKRSKPRFLCKYNQHKERSKPRFLCKHSINIKNLPLDAKICDFIHWMETGLLVKVVNQGILTLKGDTTCITIILQNAQMADYLKEKEIIYYNGQELQIEAAVPTKSLQ